MSIHVSKNVRIYVFRLLCTYLWTRKESRDFFSRQPRFLRAEYALRWLWSVVRFYDPNEIDRDKIFLRIYTISRVATSALLKPCSVRPTVANLDLLFDFIDPFSPCFC